MIYTESIERIQAKFIKALNYRTNQRINSYEESCKYHGLMQLKDRRTLLRTLFFHDVCSNKIDSPELTSLFLHINAPLKRTRHTPLFKVPFSYSNYAQNSVICRTLDTFNRDFSSMDIDIFHQSKASFKKQVISALVNLCD